MHAYAYIYIYIHIYICIFVFDFKYMIGLDALICLTPWSSHSTSHKSHGSHVAPKISQDGSIVTWGGRRSGGDASAVAKQLQVAVAGLRWKDGAFQRPRRWRPNDRMGPYLVELPLQTNIDMDNLPTKNADFLQLGQFTGGYHMFYPCKMMMDMIVM